MEAIRIFTVQVYRNPNGFLQFVNGSRFCGFSSNNFLTLDFWREFILKLPLSELVATLMHTSQVVYKSNVIHATSLQCFKDKQHIQFQSAHSDIERSPYSIEKNVNSFPVFNQNFRHLISNQELYICNLLGDMF